MLKEKAVASLGRQSLLLPAWFNAALLANDRLKLYLSMLQSAAEHAAAPAVPIADWSCDLAQAHLHDAQWLQELVKSAYFDNETLVIPQLTQLLNALTNDLTLMARPLCDAGGKAHPDLVERRDQWLQKLHALEDDDGLNREILVDLTHGDRKRPDGFHILVMDLHKQLNAMASEVETENLDGAHVWQIADEDRPLIRAFMCGLQRTSPLKFSHPGLDTAATREGSRLLIQNDIGTNDAHVLVIEVDAEQRAISLTYSDLHQERFEFFRQMLEEISFAWTVSAPVTSAGLNAGKAYLVGKAALVASDDSALLGGLEAVAARIVFVIDWNRARKRLQTFVRKPQALAILRSAAAHEWGHMAWLLAGGERLVLNAMQAEESEAFRVGDRLDDVLGETAAHDFLLELMRISSDLLLQQQPVALVADETQMLLARVLRQRTLEFDLLAEHAAYCHTLAQALSDAIEKGATQSDAEIAELVSRAKAWERQADHLLMDARQRAERQHHWAPVVELLSKADDVADALEEAVFILSMIVSKPMSGLPAAVSTVLIQLANTTLAAIQDQVKAIEIARYVSDRGESADTESFLQALWRMLRAERICDELARRARQTIIQTLHASPAGLLLANDLAASIEKASDGLLAAGYALRQMVFAKSGVSA